MGCLPGPLLRCLRPQPGLEARDATLAQTIAEAVTREMEKAHVHYQAILNKRGTATLQTSLKVSSGANGFKVMDPFDWTKDKSIYQTALPAPGMPATPTGISAGRGKPETLP